MGLTLRSGTIFRIRSGFDAIAETGICSTCKRETQLSVSYEGYKFKRKLCQECFCIGMDKLFNIDSYVEKVLYK